MDADGSLLLYEALGGKSRGFSKLRLTKYGEPWPLLCYLGAKGLYTCASSISLHGTQDTQALLSFKAPDRVMVSICRMDS